MLFLKNGLRIEESVSRSTFLMKKTSNKSQSESNFSPRSIGSSESISTNRSISLLLTSNLSLTDEPKAYTYFTLWFLHRIVKSFCLFNISSFMIINQRYNNFLLGLPSKVLILWLSCCWLPVIAEEDIVVFEGVTVVKFEWDINIVNPFLKHLFNLFAFSLMIPFLFHIRHS